MTRPVLDNTRARRIFLDRHLLAAPPRGAGRGADLRGLIGALGFVQVDSINIVARAHDMILYSRRPAYRAKHLKPLLERDRVVFEHWTHDASVIPVEFFGHWKHRFASDGERFRGRWDNGYAAKVDAVLRRISDHGPVCSADVGEDEARSSGGWWDWHPSKTALEYLWRTGALSVTRREAFRKVYDLTERVLPDCYTRPSPMWEETVDWACTTALDRLGFATSGEIAAFFALIPPAVAKAWVTRALATGRVVEVDVTMADGSLRRCVGRPGLAKEPVPGVSNRVRVLSPFDPALRDRKRAERLFGFHYRIEIFVPEAKRKYGYYVFPVLEGDRLIGRIDMKADRASGQLQVRAFWPESGVAMGAGRQARLGAEIDRVARMADCRDIVRAEGWLR